MIEVELKYRMTNVAALQSKLDAMEAVRRSQHEQVDYHFQHPVKDYAQTDEAIRVRAEDDRVYLTYKGPRIDPGSKARREIEIAMDGHSGECGRLVDLLKCLDFVFVMEVRKRRDEWVIRFEDKEVHVSLDAVDGLGDFAELEVVSDEDRLAEERDRLLRLANRLGLQDQERDGYLTMLKAIANDRTGTDG